MLDPQQRIAKPFLITRSLQPENQETPISFIENDIVRQRLFYRRNHFSYPNLSFTHYWLPISGLVKKPKLFSMQDIFRMPSKTIKMVIECSGNKRSFFEPKVFGEQWNKGAISQGYWTGVPLKDLLYETGLLKDAKEVVVEGYDYGERSDLDEVYTYSRSLPIEKALHPDTMIAYQYNNQPIPFKHGYPLRFIVPQWYGMASVKWIKQIKIIDHHFKGPFQSIDYMYYPNKEDDSDAFPVTTMNVNSIIQQPLDMEVIKVGKNVIKGIAWTGKGMIKKVEISTDEGKTWTNTVLKNGGNPNYGWTSWSYEWTVLNKGEYTIMTKASDSFQRTQPNSPFWNRKGYGYNAVDKITVKVE